MAFTKHKRKEFTGHKVVDVEMLVGRVLDKFKLADEMQFQSLSERFREVVGDLIFPHVTKGGQFRLEKRVVPSKKSYN